jgi:RimJ/RimL family protein N-acetyltransferase
VTSVDPLFRRKEPRPGTGDQANVTALDSTGPARVQPVTLRGAGVRLEPLALDHVDGLVRVGLDPELWRWIPTPVTTAQEMHSYVSQALDEQRRGVSLPFAIVDPAGERVIGCTRYGNIDLANRRLEIGWTWYATAYQRTKANTETKLLLLTHAFEALETNRVEFKTDVLNERSRNAILRLGAVQEGIFRRHAVTSTGRVRDTVYFSIIGSEWPAVKARLQAMLRSPIG